MLPRHTLVWPSGAPAAEDPENAGVVGEWFERGRPFISCRSRHSDPDRVSLGICLPRVSEDVVPRRVAAWCTESSITRTAGAPPIGDVAARLQDPRLGEVADAFETVSVNARVVGSWMWQWMAGDSGRYTTRRSDLDLVVSVNARSEADRVCELIDAFDGHSGLGVDCEIACPRGEVHWREYGSGAQEVLLKSVHGPTIVSREGLWL